MSEIHLGIDVGTGSVRVVAVEGAPGREGQILSSASEKLSIWSPAPGLYQQSSEQIWEAVCKAVAAALGKAEVEAENVKSVGFDATCSLVVLDKLGEPLSVTPKECRRQRDEEDSWNVIMWLDHRATSEADDINQTAHERLKFVGNAISPENEPPKLLWLKRNLPQLWQEADHFMDLADFLTYKATGKTTRSFCTLLCKWLYSADAESHGWDASFYQTIGLGDLSEDAWARVGKEEEVQLVGRVVGGVVEEGLGLPPSVLVTSGLIDAHSGVIGSLATDCPLIQESPIEGLLPMIAGTSTCHLPLTRHPRFLPAGFTGPQFQALGLPGLWLNEAGQSAVGATLDSVLGVYGSGLGLSLEELHAEVVRRIFEDERLSESSWMEEELGSVLVWPDYHGNRSPLGKPQLKGAVLGLELTSYDKGSAQHWEYLQKLYLAHIQAFALQTRHIVSFLGDAQPSVVLLCGGFQKNPVYLQAHADVLQIPVVIPESQESVAFGAAIIGAAGCRERFSSLTDVIKRFKVAGRVVKPRVEFKKFYDEKYKRFLQLGDLMQSLALP